VTIVFVLTQSHLVFLTSNWQNEDASRGGALRRALRRTLRPALSSAATTLLGFGTLLFVEAKPLRELGLGGVVGGSAALASAYVLYPLFLAGGEPGRRRREPGRIQAWLTRPHPAAALAIVAAALALGIGLAHLDTDPSLLDYFDEGGEIHEALAHLDRHVGSAPLQLVIERADGASLLDDEDAYASLWALQRRLEAEPTVGRVVSLPVLLAEADRRPLASILSWEMILRVLESRFADRVANGFVTEDHGQTLFSLQMVDHEREATRVEVVDRLRGVVRGAGFEVALVGGVYHLQGTLAALVARSMVESLAALALLFTGVGWITTGSLRVSLAMSAVLALVPVAVFGGLGLARVPIDVVTAPGASIGLGLAADTLLHLAVAARRADHAFGPEAWEAAIRAQGPAIARASLIVALGFGLFAFSGFPPTRRFGLVVALSMLAAAPLALVVLPRLAGRRPGGGRLARALLPQEG
jgi:predicted RND superfamily exporter protein